MAIMGGDYYLLNDATLSVLFLIFFLRSLSPFPAYLPNTNIFFPDGVSGQESEGPPSYTTVFTADVENVTPPPHYNNINNV